MKKILPYLLGMYIFAGIYILLSSSCKEEPLKAEKYNDNSKLQKNKFRCTAEELPEGNKTSGIAKIPQFWPSNPNQRTIIYVKFMNGECSPFVRRIVEHYAKQWERWANIHFEFVPDNQEAHIRITCQPNKDPNSAAAGWSVLGRSYIKDNFPTMNYPIFCGSVDETDQDFFGRIILHEFGHALGLMHEQTHPYSMVKNENIGYDKHDPSDKNNFYLDYDRYSIMHYSYSDKNTIDGIAIYQNHILSEGDKALIGAIYPFNNKRTINTETKLYTLDGKLDIFKDLPTSRIIFYPADRADLATNAKWAINPLQNDDYEITDEENKKAFFTSKTKFKIRTRTRLKGGIIIKKNGYQLHEGWISKFTESVDPNKETKLYTLDNALDILTTGEGKIILSPINGKSQINSMANDTYIINSQYKQRKYEFTSKTYFNGKITTSLYAPIYIHKNNVDITGGWLGYRQ